MSTSDSVMKHIMETIKGLHRDEAAATVTNIAEACMDLANELSGDGPIPADPKSAPPGDDDAA